MTDPSDAAYRTLERAKNAWGSATSEAEGDLAAAAIIEEYASALRASAEQMAACLEKIVAQNQTRAWTATEHNPETHWETGDGQYARLARQALATYREDKS